LINLYPEKGVSMYPIRIVDVSQSRYLESETDARGHSYAAMMEDAGRNLARAIQSRHRVDGTPILILVGPGNNGGDGLVAAHHLHQAGAQVSAYLWQRRSEGDSNLERARSDGISLAWSQDDGDRTALRGLVRQAAVIVDALLGVGISRPIEGELKEILDVVRAELLDLRTESTLMPSVPSASPYPRVFAVDCPTGLNCDTGELDPASLPADVTVTFGCPKAGLLRFPGAEAVGEIVVADIGIPPDLLDPTWPEMVSSGAVAAALPPRPGAAHKGTFGKALIVAGSVNYTGAAALAGMGAARVGTGLVTLAIPRPIHPAVAAQVPETTYLLLPHDLGVISSSAYPILSNQLRDYDALLIGPGLGQEKETAAFLQATLAPDRIAAKGRLGFVDRTDAASAERPVLPPLVMDADGLNLLAAIPEWWTWLPEGTVLTPHPGEMARLMGDDATVRSIQKDREGITSRMAQAWNCVVALKGAFTVIAAPDGQLAVNPFANPGLATAGTGDVLAGAIVGLRAQGMDPHAAAMAGVYLHAVAGELAARDMGRTGTVAGDLPARLPHALRLTRPTAAVHTTREIKRP
jgi:hydroxyethylthiazole kinase-like uncharacterized protein yjeF